MSNVTLIQCPAARFAVTAKRGTAVTIPFTIVGRSDLAANTWVAVLRKGTLEVTLGVVAALVTVDAANDSTEVTVTLTAIQSAALKHGSYFFDCMDTTDDEVWGTGTITIIRNAVIA